LDHSSKRLKSSTSRKIAAVLFITLWVLSSITCYRVWIQGADHRDFYPRWAGIRQLLSGNRDLYAEGTTRQMQIELYGAAIPAGLDQQGFAYPAQLAVMLLPFGLIPDVEIATAAWEGLSLCLLLSALLFLNNTQQKRAPIFLVAALVLWQYPLMMLFQGQVTAIPLAALAVAIGAFLRDQDWLSGAVLTLSLVKPELACVPVVTLIIFSLVSRRFELIKGFILAILIFILTSIAVAGWWFPGWIDSLGRYNAYASVVWPLGEVWRVSPLLACVMLAALAGSLVLNRRNPQWMVVASIPLGMLLLPQTLTYSLTLVTIPLLVAWKGNARYAVLAVWFIGWFALLVGFIPDLWKAQAIAIPALSIACLVLASTQVDEVY